MKHFLWLINERDKAIANYATDLSRGEFMAAAESANWAACLTGLIDKELDEIIDDREQLRKLRDFAPA